MILLVRPIAQADIARIRSHYAEIAAALAGDFVSELDAAFERIVAKSDVVRSRPR